jgi:predicted phosphohydrolase
MYFIRGFFLSIKLIINRCHVPRVTDHPSAVVHHLTHAPFNEKKEETIPLKTISNQGSGTEDNPFIVYRNSQLIDKENLQHLRFVCVSDTHNEIDKIHIPDGDVFIHCGDAVKHRTSARDIVRFNQFVGQLPHKYKLFVSGNHCVCLNPKRPDRSQKLLNNMIYLQDQLIDIKGVRIYGSPWRPKRGCFYRAEAFGYDSDSIRDDKWSNIPQDIDILLTHGPPYSIRDYNSSTKQPLGCPGLLDEIVTRVRPRIHLFGHMHACRGASLYKSEDNQVLEGEKYQSESNDILFVNLAIHQGRTLGEAVVIDYYY